MTVASRKHATVWMMHFALAQAIVAQPDSVSGPVIHAFPKVPPTSLAVRLSRPLIEVNNVPLLHQLIVALREAAGALEEVEAAVWRSRMWRQCVGADWRQETAGERAADWRQETAGERADVCVGESQASAIQETFHAQMHRLASVAMIKRRLLRCDGDAAIVEQIGLPGRSGVVFPRRRMFSPQNTVELATLGCDDVFHWAERLLKGGDRQDRGTIEARVWKCLAKAVPAGAGLRRLIDVQARAALVGMLTTADYGGSMCVLAEPVSAPGTVDFVIDISVEDVNEIRHIGFDVYTLMSGLAGLARTGTEAGWSDSRASEQADDAAAYGLRVVRLCETILFLEHMYSHGVKTLSYPEERRPMATSLHYRNEVSMRVALAGASPSKLLIGGPAWVEYEDGGQRRLRPVIGLQCDNRVEEVVASWAATSRKSTVTGR